MRTDIRFRALVTLALAAVALAALPAGAATTSKGYLMRAKVLKIHADATLDLWVSSAHRLPRDPRAATGVDLSQLPRVVATLEFKYKGQTPGLQAAGLTGSLISLRGNCTEIDRMTREPVVQVQLETGRRWQQARLDPHRKGHRQLAELAGEACSAATADEPADEQPTNGSG